MREDIKFVNAENHYHIQNVYIQRCEDAYINCYENLTENNLKTFLRHLSGLYEFSYSFLRKEKKVKDLEVNMFTHEVSQGLYEQFSKDELFSKLITAKRDIYEALHKKRMRLPFEMKPSSNAGKNSVVEIE